MFNWRKNKKEDKFSDSDAQAKVKKNEDVTFHTMQDDLNAPKEKIMAGEWGKDEKNKTERKKERSGSEIQYTGKDTAKKDASRYSPFLDDTPAAPKSFTIPSESSEPAKDKNRNEQKISAVTDKKDSDPKIDRGTVLKIFTFLLVIITIFLGAYFFWITRNPIEIPHTSGLPETQNSTEEAMPEETVPEKYSVENPNYLSIDTESVTSEDIFQLLIKTASEIKESKNDGPFEFIVTDANNNSLSFSIFAYLAKLNLSQNVLDSFDESFSLYFYRDGDNVKTGLAIDITDKETANIEFAKEENTLVKKLQPLFLGSSFQETSQPFNTGQYKNFQIRYINLNEDNTLSVDYLIVENQLVIGTSKNTARAIIDRIEQSENSSTEENVDADIEL